MRRYGLIGRPLGHSASAAYFAAKFEREGIADCAYALYELPDIGALEGLLARTPDLCGFIRHDTLQTRGDAAARRPFPRRPDDRGRELRAPCGRRLADGP